MTCPDYVATSDVPQLLRDHPIGAVFAARYKAMSADELRAIRNRQFLRLIDRGWAIPVYARHRGARGVEPSKIRSPDHVPRLPAYDKTDLMASITAHPPFGDFPGLDDPANRPPIVLHTTSGTTGKPLALLFRPKGRKVGNLRIVHMARREGLSAGEGPKHDGVYVWEDARHLENCDVDTGAPVATGQKGDMVVICLYKNDIAPCIRFNTHDVSAFRTDSNHTGTVFRRIEGFLGRSDNMVTLKGINVFPHVIGALIDNRAELTGAYVCRMTRKAKGNDTMTVTLEHRAADSDTSGPAALLRQGLGVEVAMVPTGPGGTAAATQIDVRQKPIRLIDERRR